MEFEKTYQKSKGLLVKALVGLMLIFISFRVDAQAEKSKNVLKLTVIPMVEDIYNNECYVQLLENNIALSTSSGKIHNVFYLKKDKEYTIKITRAGCPDKIVNVSTKIPADSEGLLYAYEVKAQMHPKNGAAKEITESPLVVAFNDEIQEFSNNDMGLVIK